MTDKELRKLRRSDLLEMLIEQKKIVASNEKQVEKERADRGALERRLQEMDETVQWLRKKLDEKDQTIHELRAALEERDRKGANGESSIDSVTAKLNKAVEVFEKAAGKIQKK